MPPYTGVPRIYTCTTRFVMLLCIDNSRNLKLLRIVLAVNESVNESSATKHDLILLLFDCCANVLDILSHPFVCTCD